MDNIAVEKLSKRILTKAILKIIFGIDQPLKELER